MSVAISNQTVSYVNVAATSKSSIASSEDGFSSVVSKAGKTTPVYRVGKSTTGESKSVVDDYKKKHPEQAGSVNKMLSSGIRAREMYGVSGVNTEEMTMDEYKSYISDILDQIPFHASRPYDEEVIYISDEGWEQMKQDPDYEAWVLGYNVVNRSVVNPFFGLGDKGAFGIEHFGASIEEHHGEGYSKVYGGTARGARSMFEAAASGKGAIRKNAPRSTEQPPEDWSLEEEQRKARGKRKSFWDEIFETQLKYREQLKNRLNTEYLNNRRETHSRMMADFSKGSLTSEYKM